MYNFLYLNKNGLSGYIPSGNYYITLKGWIIRKYVLSIAIRDISKSYNPNPHYRTSQREMKEKNDLLSTVLWSGDHNRLYREKIDSQEYNCWFDKKENPKIGFFYDHYNNRYTVVDYQEGDYTGRIFFRGDEKIKSVETDKRLLKVNLEDGEQLVALKATYNTHTEEAEFFSGRLVRRGYTIEFLKDKKRILTFTEGIKS